MKLIKKFFLLIRYKMWIKGLLNGVAANVELLPLIHKIKRINTLIDVGSNKGQFILLSLKFFPDIKVFSFEPIKEILKKQKKFFKFYKKIIYYNLGIGSKNEYSNFFITNRIDSSSFLKINDSKNYNKNYNIIEKREIRIATLDKILKEQKLVRPILMKIDVQGYELEVLRGALKILKKIDYLILEVSKNKMYKKQPIENEVLKFLKKNSFIILGQEKWTRIINTSFDQRDILLKRK